jgi:DNA-directed RNA polymerase specialized sigma subunit
MELTQEQAWAASQSIVHSLIRRYLKKTIGLTYDDLLSEAGLAFVEAYNGFDAERGTKFETWLYTKINSRMMEIRRVTAKRWKRTESDVSLNDEDADLNIGTEQNPFADVLDEMTEDARLLADLILTSSLALQAELNPRSALNSLAQFMRENYGWTIFRSRITFMEMQEALGL